FAGGFAAGTALQQFALLRDFLILQSVQNLQRSFLAEGFFPALRLSGLRIDSLRRVLFPLGALGRRAPLFWRRLLWVAFSPRTLAGAALLPFRTLILIRVLLVGLVMWS